MLLTANEQQELLGEKEKHIIGLFGGAVVVQAYERAIGRVRDMGYRGSVAPEPVESAAAAGRDVNSIGSNGGAASFDANLVIILAALFFALLFAIGLNSLARCGLRGDADEAGASSSGNGAGGVKKRALRSIPVEVYCGGGGEEEQEVCAICLGEFADGEKVRVLPRCRHGFHVRCVDAWLLARGSCPTCRRPVMAGTHAKGGGSGVGQSRRPPDSDTIAVVVT